jgi:hypothetical protein
VFKDDKPRRGISSPHQTKSLGHARCVARQSAFPFIFSLRGCHTDWKETRGVCGHEHVSDKKKQGYSYRRVLRSF